MMKNKAKVGVLALGRTTFDVPYAQEMLAQAWQALSGMNIELVGEPTLQFDAESALQALPALKQADLDLLLILQVTFTDASLTTEVVRDFPVPTAMWSFPEARTGGRLRLNSFCGVNLACHALSREAINVQTLHGLPSDSRVLNELQQLAQAAAIVKRFKQAKVMVIGEHPLGFDACNYNQQQLKQHFGVEVTRQPVLEFIDEVKALPDSVADAPYARRAKDFPNLAEMDQTATRKTLKVYSALREKAQREGYTGIAVRCWPDFFTDYGCAACGALALMNEDKVPCGCEADMFGVLSSLMAQWASGNAAFNTDLVDIDPQDNSVVFWHCGQAPIEMADRDGPVQATIHSNRKLPLLSEFALKPGRITLCRITQGEGKLRLMLAGGEMLKAPLAFSGTAGTARLDVDADTYRQRLIAAGMEHHTSLVYGEHRPLLRKVADLLGLDVIELT
ncbi:L-fucose isomerase-like protein [Serratia fonticola]|jgi:L-fucose isomerase-like protein|uniref:L-fucose isomerase-like protein n=1 Tax=Serratia fonticola TaxID=47917 RepID=A0A542BTF1_SERFO|nr:L-fucose/L-arabinose isomerase family protein [Serratia fonticola]TQI81855.1 L-fucose isomerase-like protein [Serratia fonticola]TQI96122.1 L-fucose isomerase-like protein [Serratia fonticola]TVZ70619.1 L-fucose isomerase-like protein [Serratia fonticola]